MNAIWVKDDCGKMDDSTNPDFVTRVSLTAKAANVKFFCSIISYVFNIPEYLLNGVIVIFSKNKDDFILLLQETATTKNCKT